MKKHYLNLVAVVRSNIFIFSVLFLVMLVAVVYSSRILAEDSIPASPSNLIVDGAPTSTSISIKWNDNASNEDKFNIDRMTYPTPGTTLSSNGTSFVNIAQITTADTTSYTDTTISPGVSYIYRVQACLSEIGCSGYTFSSSITAGINTTTPPAVTQTIPDAPTNLAIDGTTSSSVKLKWNDNASNEDKFNIERAIMSTTTGSTTASVGAFVFLVQITVADTTSYTDTTVTPGTVYAYRVQACLSETGCSSYSTLGSVIIPPIQTTTTPPTTTIPPTTIPPTTTTVNAPTNLILYGNPIPNYINLKWNDNSNNEEKFVIERRVSVTTSAGTTVSNFINLNQSSANTTYYIDSAVSAGVFYDYRVKACISNNVCSSYATLYHVGGVTNSPNSNNNSPSTTTVIPNAPTELSSYGIPTSSSIVIKWKDNANNEDKFNIERKTIYTNSLSTMSSFIFLKQITTSNINYYVDNTVSPGLSYVYRVQACLSGTGCSGYSTSPLIKAGNIITPTTPPVNNPTPTPSTTPPPTTVPPPVTTPTPTPSTIPPVNTPPTTPPPTTVPPPTNTVSIIDNIANNLFPRNDKENIKNQVQTENPVQIVPEREPLKSILLSQPEMIVKDHVVKKEVVNKDDVLPKLQNLGDIITTINSQVEDARKKLIKIIDQNISDISNSSDSSINKDELSIQRDALVAKITSELDGSIILSQEDLKNLEEEVSSGLEKIRSNFVKNVTVSEKSNDVAMQDTKDALDTLGGLIEGQATSFKENGGALLYKDTNTDGISDYDSVYVYNIDPVKPSPTTVYEGKKINASEKIILGFDPKETTLKTVEKEQPAVSTAPVVSIYKVDEIKLTENKEIKIKGKALPNSFVTIYIYSTPIMVTVKTDSNGEWQYTLDKELEDGQHTIFTATVNNTGKIIAKSSPSVFSKTAEAATLEDAPLVDNSTNVEKPNLIGQGNIYIFGGYVLLVILIVIILAGFISRKKQ